MKCTVKKVGESLFGIFLWTFLLLALLSLVLTLVSRKDEDGTAEIFGYEMRIVTSDSMAACEETDVSAYEIGSIPIRSMVFVTLVPEENTDAWYRSLRVGDVLTIRYVYTHQVTITHRITSISEKETGGFVISLAGDNKSGSTEQLYQTIDTSVPNSMNYVIGKVTHHSYLLGFLVSIMKTPLGIIFTVILPCLIIILREILRIIGILQADRSRQLAEVEASKDAELASLRARLAALEEQSKKHPTEGDDTAP